MPFNLPIHSLNEAQAVAPLIEELEGYKATMEKPRFKKEPRTFRPRNARRPKHAKN